MTQQPQFLAHPKPSQRQKLLQAAIHLPHQRLNQHPRPRPGQLRQQHPQLMCQRRRRHQLIQHQSQVRGQVTIRSRPSKDPSLQARGQETIPIARVRVLECDQVEYLVLLAQTQRACLSASVQHQAVSDRAQETNAEATLVTIGDVALIRLELAVHQQVAQAVPVVALELPVAEDPAVPADVADPEDPVAVPVVDAVDSQEEAALVVEVDQLAVESQSAQSVKSLTTWRHQRLVNLQYQ